MAKGPNGFVPYFYILLILFTHLGVRGKGCSKLIGFFPIFSSEFCRWTRTVSNLHFRQTRWGTFLCWGSFSKFRRWSVREGYAPYWAQYTKFGNSSNRHCTISQFRPRDANCCGSRWYHQNLFLARSTSCQCWSQILFLRRSLRSGGPSLVEMIVYFLHIEHREISYVLLLFWHCLFKFCKK